ncbi:hypothetical protein SASPL_147727 [Salvia splendens]|uniref:APO domain-containing protein n=1 Tax=Salvia splendens TaxID=180675 RepID=A0A8X8WF38_SALSN|nr:hypothetical protein SASPL_147727 [Salvia splendens]
MILKRIEHRARDYPVKPILPAAREVLRARTALYSGFSTLLCHIPVWACKYCPEVYIGEGGHLIQTCHGYRRHVVELCLQAGVDSNDPIVSSSVITPFDNTDNHRSFSEDDLRLIGRQTLDAWEKLRSGVHKLLFVYPARVCKHCGEVHVGPSGHKARTCGVFKFESWSGTQFWKKAGVDDMVPLKESGTGAARLHLYSLIKDAIIMATRLLLWICAFTPLSLILSIHGDSFREDADGLVIVDMGAAGGGVVEADNLEEAEGAGGDDVCGVVFGSRRRRRRGTGRQGCRLLGEEGFEPAAEGGGTFS